MILNVMVHDNIRAEARFSNNGSVYTNLFGTWRKITDQSILDGLMKARAFGTMSARNASEWQVLSDKHRSNPDAVSVEVKDPWEDMKAEEAAKVAATNGGDVKVKKSAIQLRNLCKRWLDFFSEFGGFKPQARLMNSIANFRSAEAVAEYIVGYFSLTNNSYASSLAEKTKSHEFQELARETIGTAESKINSRLEIYYGEPGSGKTTDAINNFPEAEVVLCHANLTPDELFRGFDFEDGKPIFRPCPLKKAMVEGKVVILDEINLLTDECRRALQAICDTKEEVTITNEVIKIKPGFKVVGTMNLFVDEVCCPLPAPLVDRAEVIRCYEMTAEKLASIAF